MDFYKKCPSCGETGGFVTSRIIYECSECDHRFCDKCRKSDNRCPECGSKSTTEIGKVA